MNKKLLKLVTAACSLTLAASIGLGVANSLNNNPANVNAYEIALDSENELQSEYAYGSTVTIPMGTIEGVQTNKFVVVSPSGSVYNSVNLTLSEVGQYTIVWYATVGGREVYAEKTFTSTQSVFSINGGATYQYMESLSKKTDMSGLKIAVEPESTIRFNNAIDLTDSSIPLANLFPYHGITNIVEITDALSDVATRIKAVQKEITTLEKEIKDLDLLINSEETSAEDKETYKSQKSEKEVEKVRKEATLSDYEHEQTTYKNSYKYYNDAGNYLITLTDCYDPTKYVTIDLEWQEDRTYWNFRAGANGQTAHGLRSKITDESLKVEVDGAEYQYHMAPGQGLTSCNMVDNYGIQLYYDTATNRVYATFCRYASGKYTVNQRNLVADLSNTTIYPDNAFEGFTTGEVYVSISAKNHYNSAANLEIASLGSYSGEELTVMGKDTTAPVIQIDERLAKYNTIALNEEITVPDATALDLNLPYGTKATKAVYYAYSPNSSNNAVIGLKNGKFTPTKQGSYTIVYTATDRNGNLATATVDLQCKSSKNNQAINFVVEESVQASAGNYVQIPEFAVEGLYTDTSAVKVYLRGNNGAQNLVTSSELFLEGVKNYELTYVYETPFKTYTATCTIVSVASDKVAMDNPVLPEYFIKGATYTLDTVYAYEYTAEKPVAVQAKAYMRKDNATDYEEVTNTKAVLIDAEESVQFKYEYKGEVRYSETIKVVDVGFKTSAFSIKDFFHSEEDVFTKSAATDGAKYVTNGAEKATMKYVNVLSLPSFAVEFTLFDTLGEGTYTAPKTLTFTIVDYYNRDNKVSVTFENNNTATKIYLDGVLAGTIARPTLGTKLSVSYNNGFTVDGVTYAWTNNFTSEKMLLWVEMDGMEGASCLNISKLCGNKFTDATKDKADPVLYISKTNNGYQDYNKVITLSKASACDIFAPYVESGLRLTVRKPDGNYATSLDGVVLNGTCPVDREYQIKLDEIGIYNVLYEYVDQNGNNCSFGNYPTIRDQVAPTLTVEGKVQDQVVTAKWGATVEVAKYTVSDDLSKEDKIIAWVNVFYPDGQILEVANGGTFHAKKKGKYTIFYSAYDEVGNFTTFAYYVMVD